MEAVVENNPSNLETAKKLGLLEEEFEKIKEILIKMNAEYDLLQKHKLEDILENINNDISKMCSDTYVEDC